jgi:hypothetical protein
MIPEPPKATKRRSPRRLLSSPVFDGAYTKDQLEFLAAIQKYKIERRRPFPNWTEVLDVLLSLGYRKPAGADKEEP